MNTKQLRQKILDLAIRGKLVPQDPTDEPASALLERVRAEKERLIKEGKIKRGKGDKAGSATSDKSHYGSLPQGWATCALEIISDITSSKRIFAKEYVSSGVPFFRTKEIVELSRGKDISTELFITEQ
jgi:type I restriction enzyme S subunit